jgi:nitroreductase
MGNVAISSSTDILERYSSDAELARSLPKKPVFPCEYRLLQFGKGSVIILGAGPRQIIKCSFNILELKSTLELMDGSRTIEKIVFDIEKQYLSYSIKRDDILSFICSLHDLGMFEEAHTINGYRRSAKNVDVPINTEAFLGRMCGLSGIHPNRHEMWDQLRATKVFIIGNNKFSHTLEKDFIQAGVNVTSEPQANIVIVLYRDAEELNAARGELLSLKQENGNTFDVLFLGLSSEGLFLGPLTNCDRSDRFFSWLDCFFKNSKAIFDSSRSEYSIEGYMSDRFYSCYSVSAVFNLIVGIGEAFIYECVNVVKSSHNSPEVEQRSFSLSSYVSPQDIPEYYSNERAFEVLMTGALFSGAEIPPSKYISPRVHRKHYTAANIALTKEKSARFYGVKRVAFEQLSKICETHSVDYEGISRICGVAFGEEKQKRLTPTGGDLRSTEAIILISPNQAQPDEHSYAGVYRYCPEDHCLELIGSFPDEYFNLKLSGVHLVVVSRYQKVYEKYYAGTFKITNLDVGVAYTAARWAAENYQLQLRLRIECDLQEVEKHIALPFSEGRYCASSIFSLAKDNNRGLGHSEGYIEVSQGDTKNIFKREWSDKDKGNFDNLHIDHYLLELSKKGFPNILPDKRVKVHAINEAKNSEEFLRVIRSRRAHRVFDTSPIDDALIESYLIKANDSVEQVMPGMTDGMLHYWVMDQARNKLIYFNPKNSLFQYDDLKQVRVFNQELLSFAPAAMVIGIPVKEIAMQYGAAGLKYAIQCCGAALHNVWLNAEIDGLRACIAGGIIPESFSSIVSEELSSIQPIATICFGREFCS